MADKSGKNRYTHMREHDDARQNNDAILLVYAPQLPPHPPPHDPYTPHTENSKTKLSFKNASSVTNDPPRPPISLAHRRPLAGLEGKK